MMNLVEIKSDEVLKTLYSFLVNQENGTVLCVHDKKMVLVPKAKVVDENLCYELGYDIIEEPYTGGVIVADVGDIWVVNFGKLGNSFRKQFAEYMVDCLKSKGLSAVYEDNDILVDGYKISGSAGARYSNIEFSAFHIGINTNLEDIKKICTKPMNKIPKGLSEYNITTEEIKQMILEFYETYNHEGGR